MNRMRKNLSGSYFFRNHSIVWVLVMASFSTGVIAQNVAASRPTAQRKNETREVNSSMRISELLIYHTGLDTFESELNGGSFIGELKYNKSPNGNEKMYEVPIYFNEVLAPLMSNSLKHETAVGLMPVALKSFQTGYENLRPCLSWVAAVEDNLKYYAVQRSIDGLEFQNIAFVFPEPIQLVDSKYSFTDYEMPAGTVGVIYYRLMLSNSDGTEDFSGIKTMYLGLGERNKWSGINFDGTIKALSYRVRTAQRPEMELEEDPHPWPASGDKSGVQKVWEEYKTQVKIKVKSIWNINH